jgi:hypothetical protein
MGVSREELKAKLVAKAEAAIESLVQDVGLHEHMTLSEIEQMVGQPEAAFRQAVLDELLVVQQSKPSSCPVCVGKLENKGKRRRHVVSLRGEAEIERCYYHCQTCDQGYFPPGSAVRLE